MRAEAARYTGQEAQVMEYFRKNPGAADTLKGPIFEEKVVDFIVDQATVTEKPVSSGELVEPPSPPLPSEPDFDGAPSEVTSVPAA